MIELFFMLLGFISGVFLTVDHYQRKAMRKWFDDVDRVTATLKTQTEEIKKMTDRNAGRNA